MSSINDKAIFKELHAICFFFFSLLNTEDCFSLSARTKCATAHFHHHRYNGKKKLCNNMKTEKEKILNQNETIYSLLVSFHNGIFTSSLRFAFSFSPKIEIERWNFISDYQNYCITETERFFFFRNYTLSSTTIIFHWSLRVTQLVWCAGFFSADAFAHL